MKYEIFDELRKHADSEQAHAMSAYMKNRYSFLGINKPLRTQLCKEFLAAKSKQDPIDWQFIDDCFAQTEREYQYLGISYLNAVMKRLRKEDLSRIETLLKTKSWWDTVDSIDQAVMHLLRTYPEIKEQIKTWAIGDELWLKRVAIVMQRHRKEETDTDLLQYAIVNNLGSNEFFINKAIGWALRSYSKTNPDWVRTFLSEHELSMLSVREASKCL